MAAARLGAAVTFVGAVGADEMGDESLADLAAEGIDVGRVARLAESPTGVALIVVDEAGENQIAVASGANGGVDAALVESALRDYEYATGGVLLTNFEVPDEAILAAARVTPQRRGCASSSIPPRREPAGCARCAWADPGAQLLEAQTMSGETDPEAAARALSGEPARR